MWATIFTISIILTACSHSFGNINIELDVMRGVYENCCQGESASCLDWMPLANNTVDTCSLSGIRCTPEGFIAGINASGFGLSCDSQMQQLQLLDRLEHLDISNNKISGIIPQYLSESLTELYVDNNEFIGSIPIPYATHPSLSVLSASNNQLSELPIEWKALIYQNGDASFPLRYVNLTGNSIKGPFPQGLAFYPLLETLDLSNNNITGDLGPREYDDAFKSLKTLKVVNNMLQGHLPSWTRYVPDLQVEGNDISSLDYQSTTSGLSGGAIAGIVIGTVIAIAVLVIVTVLLWKRYRMDRFERYTDEHIAPSNIM